jgi:hypothetical protein
MDLGKFNPDDFETHEIAFINLMAQMHGVQVTPYRRGLQHGQ